MGTLLGYNLMRNLLLVVIRKQLLNYNFLMQISMNAIHKRRDSLKAMSNGRFMWIANNGKYNRTVMQKHTGHKGKKHYRINC